MQRHKTTEDNENIHFRKQANKKSAFTNRNWILMPSQINGKSSEISIFLKSLLLVWCKQDQIPVSFTEAQKIQVSSKC